MNRDTTLTAGSVLGVIVGLVILLYGEAMHMDALIPAGGVVTLIGVGVLTGYVARL